MVTSATPVTKTKTSLHSWLTSKVSLLAEVDRTELRKGTKFTKRSQTSRKSAKRMRDFSGKKARGTAGRGTGCKKYHANGPLPSLWGSSVNDLECFGRKTKIEN